MMAQAERAGNIQLAYQYLNKADKIEVGDPWLEYKKWVLSYSRVVLSLLYDKKADMNDLCVELLELHKIAKNPETHIYSLVKEMDVRLLISVLQKQYRESTAFPVYESLALELIKMIEREKWYEIDGEDLYAFAYGALGNHHVHLGKVVLGEKYLRKIWNRLEEKDFLTKYEFCGLVNLGSVLAFQGKIEFAAEVYDVLWEKLYDGKIIKPYQGDINKMVGEYAHLLDRAGEMDQAFGVIQDSIDSNLVCFSSGDYNILPVYFDYLQEMDRREQEVSSGMLDKISHIMAMVKANMGKQFSASWQQCNYYQTYYFLEKAKGSPHAAKYLDESIGMLLEGKLQEGDRFVYFNCMARAIKIYRGLGQFEKTWKCAVHILGKLQEFYSMAEYYTDNDELEAYLGICKTGFYFAYMTCREYVDVEKCFEYSMNYKNILCSVIRARNQCADPKHREKREDELAFYTLEQLSAQLPEQSAVMEFLYVGRTRMDTGRLMMDTQADMVFLEIFVLVKNNGVRILHHTVPENQKLSEEVSRFIGLVQSSSGKYQNVARSIYEKVFEPFVKELEGVEHLFISPDLELCNMPFEILLRAVGKEDSGVNVVYVQSLRSIFEIWDFHGEALGGACAIGNPAFQLTDLIREQGGNSSIRQLDKSVQPLPYSEYEARMVAEVLNGFCFIGKQATKYTIDAGYRYFHIATHGILQSEEQNAWYESMLAFSGFEDLFCAGKKDRIYGDGALTAQEISRMDLAGTELVVLAACNSGSSVFSRFEQQVGLHVAFGAAGVKYVISALWEVDDLAAVLLMFFFYCKIREGGKVPEAMRYAKNHLRDVTIQNIRDILQESRTGLEHSEIGDLLWFQELPEDYMPYRASRYWGSFVCYQYKF